MGKERQTDPAGMHAGVLHIVDHERI